jgi:hypothetical protein
VLAFGGGEALGVVGGMVAVAGGIYVTVHEVRRRERRVTRREIEDLTDEVHTLRVLLLQQRRYIYRVVTMLIDRGIDVPQPPDPSFDRNEYPDATKGPSPEI